MNDKDIIKHAEKKYQEDEDNFWFLHRFLFGRTLDIIQRYDTVGKVTDTEKKEAEEFNDTPKEYPTTPLVNPYPNGTAHPYAQKTDMWGNCIKDIMGDCIKEGPLKEKTK